MVKKKDPKKGEPVEFINGAHDTHGWETGWLRADLKHTPCFYHVIVAIKDEADLEVRVTKKNVRVLSHEPDQEEDIAAYILWHHPDVEKAMDTLAEMIAQCGIGGGSQLLLRIFWAKIQLAFKLEKKRGCKGRWSQTKGISFDELGRI